MNTAIPVASFLPDGTVPAARLSLSTLQKVALPVGAILFDLLFWQERAAFNMLLYALFVVLIGVIELPRKVPQWRSGGFQLTLVGTLLSAIMVAWYGSGVAQLACVVSLAAWLGYRNQPHMRLLSFALLTALSSAARVLPGLVTCIRLPDNLSGQASRGWFYVRLLGIPLLVLVVFHILFMIANPVYNELVTWVLDTVGEWVEALLDYLEMPHVLFFLFGLIVTGMALVLVPVHYFADQESRLGEFIERQRDRVASFAVRRPDFREQRFRALDLRKEYLVAVGLLGLVNGLLLVVNIIDIKWIWFGFEPAPDFDLTQFVHEGTYILILSILLAMGIVLWFFRRNLNFYQRGLPLLRGLATVWVLQNVVLTVSVGLRNYHYIAATELAYKRIGVCGFLLLTFFGLITVLLKIWQRRTTYSLVRLNSLAAYALLLGLACGNWEVWIARYNLRPAPHALDYSFLLDMPDRVLPVLAANQEVLPMLELRQETYDGTWIKLDPDLAADRLRLRLAAFRAAQQVRRWPSYTYADWQAYKDLAK